MTEFNAAMAYNMDKSVKGIYPAFTIDYPKAMVSRGNLAGALNVVAGTTVPGEIEFTWDNNSGIDGSLPEDKVMVVVYNPVEKEPDHHQWQLPDSCPTDHHHSSHFCMR